MFILKNATTGESVGPVAIRPTWYDGYWRVVDHVSIIDADGTGCEVEEVLPTLTPMQFYLSFTPAERRAIKESTLPDVMEFWDTYQRAERTNTQIDPNSPAVQGGLGYLALAVDAKPVAGPGILAPGRVAQILAGVTQ